MKRLIVFVFAVALLGSCSSEKALHSKIPKREMNMNNISFSNIQNRDKHVEISKNNNAILMSNNILKSTKKVFETSVLEDEKLTTSTLKMNPIESKEIKSLKKTINNLNTTEGDCDNIIFRNGKEISGKIIEITTEVVKYKRCDNLDGPIISVEKSELVLVIYKNGVKEVFDYPKNNSKTKEPVTNWASIVGISLSGLGFILLWPIFWLGIAIGPVGIAFSVIGYLMGKKYPEKYKTKSTRLLSLLGGIIGVAAIIADIIWVALWW